jgi:2,4-dichlorophenol 6-monooxygenase
MSANRFETTPILIVGGGPAGLLASILLSKYQIRHILLERRSGPQQAPAAHVINTRTMEILRAAGLNTADFYDLNTHPEANRVSWVKTPRDTAIGEFHFNGDQSRMAHRAMVSPEHITNISQNHFESALLDIANSHAEADIRFSHQWQKFIDNDKKRCLVTDERDESYEIKAEFILAADGASSPIAKDLSIIKKGPSSLASYLSISCEVDITTITKRNTSLIYWCLSPKAPGVVIVHDPKKLSVYMRPLYAPFESIDDYDDDRCHDILKQLFGPEVSFKICHKGVWQMTAQVAEDFRRDNVFLIGDSAHRFPPTGGLGLNSGAADVHNLVWKLAAALNNNLTSAIAEQLFDSYEAERKPVAQTNCDTSVHNHFKMDEVISAMGLEVGQAHIPAKVRSWLMWQYLPDICYRWVDGLLASKVERKLNLLSPETQREIQVSIDSQAAHFDMLGAELGFVYYQNETKNTVRDYLPNAEIGARLPHLNFELHNGIQSSLDLIDYRCYCLFTHGLVPPENHQLYGLDLKQIDILDAKNSELIATGFNLPLGEWLLVRPDGHIASRST